VGAGESGPISVLLRCGRELLPLATPPRHPDETEHSGSEKREGTRLERLGATSRLAWRLRGADFRGGAGHTPPVEQAGVHR
jgi:hypothetical protein